MDFRPTPVQRQLVDAAEALLSRQAGPARARELRHGGAGVDAALAAALHEAGFADAFAEDDAGPLGVGLVVEAVARHAGCAPVVGPLLLGPAVLGRTDLATLAVVDADRAGPVRFAAPGPAVVLRGDRARLVELDAAALTAVPVPYAFPMARVTVPDGGEDLGPVAQRLRDWWRVGLALEMSGVMREAVRMATAYAQQRDQFGRPIGAFQSVQHRLATAAAMVEGVRWLAYEAAWRRAEPAVAASAAGYAARAAARVMRDAHQVHGAIGFTVEADLHLWTMRLPVLRLEAGGADAHRRAAGAAWLAAAPA